MKPTSIRRVNLAALLPAGTEERVEVPVPPSTNHLFATAGKGRVVSAEYGAWREAAYPILGRLARPAEYPVEVWLTLAGAGVNQLRDIANVEKGAVDGLVAVGVLPDDCLKYVAGCHQVYRPDAGPERLVIEFRAPARAGDSSASVTSPLDVSPGRRTKAQVIELRTKYAMHGGCCERFADQSGCSCFTDADGPCPECGDSGYAARPRNGQAAGRRCTYGCPVRCSVCNDPECDNPGGQH